jgi:RNA polymerase sigma-70 factor (ECF subfamily)
MESAEIDEIVRAVKAGDRERYGLLVAGYQQQIFKYCFHMLGQLQESEDVTQEVFLRGLERLESYREGTSFGAWLYKIAYHECLNRLKRGQTYLRLLRLFSRAVPVIQPDRHLAGLAYNPELREALLLLAPKDRHIILQRIVEDYRFEKIAGQLDMSYAAVRKRYERTIRKLRQHIADKEEHAHGQSLFDL